MDTIPQGKRCVECGEVKPLTEFWKYARSPDKLQYRCRTCQGARKKAWNQKNPERTLARNAQWRRENPERNRALKMRHYLKKKYGLTPAEYQAMLDRQGGRCAICNETYQSQVSGIGPLEVDHDHQTGAVRGLLCRTCNMGIGLFADSVDLLRAATAYIERGRAL